MTKAKRPLITFGKFDTRDLLHAAIGLVIYVVLFFIAERITLHTSFDLALASQWLGVMGTFALSFLWEFGQNRYYGASVDMKDVLVSTLPGLILNFILW